MPFFKKKPDAKDLEAAKLFISKIRPGTDRIVDRFDPVCQGPVEFTMLLTCSYLCSGKLPKNVNAYIPSALVQSFKKWEIKKTIDAEIGFVSIYLEQIHNTFQTARKRGLNPIEEIFEAYFKNGLLKHDYFTQNPFFLIEVKRAINDVIEKEMITSLYPYKFAAGELIFPKPLVYINLNKAKVIQLKDKNGQYTNFFIAQTIEKNHHTYWCLMENEDDTPFIVQAIKKPDGNFEIAFLDNNEHREIAEIYIKNDTIFRAYQFPLY